MKFFYSDWYTTSAAAAKESSVVDRTRNGKKISLVAFKFEAEETKW